jgi:hypothetical protein
MTRSYKLFIVSGVGIVLFTGVVWTWRQVFSPDKQVFPAILGAQDSVTQNKKLESPSTTTPTQPIIPVLETPTIKKLDDINVKQPVQSPQTTTTPRTTRPVNPPVSQTPQTPPDSIENQPDTSNGQNQPSQNPIDSGKPLSKYLCSDGTEMEGVDDSVCVLHGGVSGKSFKRVLKMDEAQLEEEKSAKPVENTQAQEKKSPHSPSRYR